MPFAIILLAAALPLIPADSSTAGARVDEIFRLVSGGKLPGAALAVIRDGQVVQLKCFGMADVEKGTPIAPSTIFRLASVTKTFTSTAVLQLVEKGKLKLTDPLSRFVLDYPGADRILISHLLNHTAGVPDFMPYEEAKKRPLEFEPGSRINYSNNGYHLLGRVIEKVSGQPWHEYLRENIFTPLGMNSTGFDRQPELPGRATGYLVGKDGAYTPIAMQDARGAGAAGGLYSTIEDMLRWAKALEDGKLLSKSVLERAWTPGKLPDGRQVAYGLGWMTRDYRGLRQVGHGGDITGFNTFIARYPSEKLTIIVLSNAGMRPPGPLPDAGAISERIAGIWLEDRMQKPGERPAHAVPSALLDAYAGRYKYDASAEVVRNMGGDLVIVRQADRLFAEVNGTKIPLDARSETQFQAPGSPAELTFVCGGLEKCPKVVVTLMGLREFNALRADPVPTR